MIEICGLKHAFGPKVVLDGIDLTVPDNTIMGLVGINGAGKSTFLRLLAGVYLPDEGTIRFDGEDPKDAVTRQNIFFLPDDPYYTSAMTPTSVFQFYKTFYPNIDMDIYKDLLSKYDIDLKGKMRNFSKGMRRQVFIALALAIKPKYLLLDEAFDGLDPLSRKLFKDAIISCVESSRTTVIIASHSLRELEDFCDSFILLDNNKIKHHGGIADHVGSFCKFELAFTEPVEETAFSHLPVFAITIRGRFIQIVLEGDSEPMRQELEKLNPAVMDEMPLDFEEMFIYDVQKKEVQP